MRGRPEVLWYGEPGADKMHDRHRRSEAPLSLGGRMFVEGWREQTKTPLLLSFDAYNGLPYWEREFPGAERLDITQDCGNLAVSPHGLFVVTDKACHQLDLATGATLRTFPVPPGADGQPGFLERAAEILRKGDFNGNPSSYLCSPKYCPRYASCRFRAI